MFGMRINAHKLTKCYAYNMTVNEHALIHTKDGLTAVEVSSFFKY
jgi:hypothetical protein